MRIALNQFVILIFLCGIIAPLGRGQASATNLQMFVSPRASSACHGEKALILDVLIVNQGKEDVSLDVGKYRASIAFSTVSGAASTVGQSSGIAMIPDRVGPLAASHILILKSKQVFTEELTLSLSDVFFSKPGLYRAMPSITFGSIERPASLDTGFIFELRDCE
jgi:hypothetical protein